MFMSDKVICLLYVDYCLWFFKKQENINEVISSFCGDGDKYNWVMTEGQSQTVSEFWVIEMTSVDYGKGFKITQYGLVNNNLKTCGIEYCKSRPTTTDVLAPLGTDSLGKESRLQDEWKDSLVIDMLMYMASNSRPYIFFAVHQCERFTHNFKQFHEKAVLRI